MARLSGAPREAMVRRKGAVTILVVEDETDVRGLVREILESAGHRVVVAASPEDALNLAGQAVEGADLLLTDMIMPGMTGKDLALQLQAKAPGLRVLFMSGYTAQAAGQQSLLSPGDAFIQKPFTPATLLEKVREALQ
jgi:CheY-like chemotaxis protein